MKVLFCTDGSEISFNALKNYLEFYAPKTTEIDYICAIDWSFLPDNVIIEESGFVNNCRNIADDILNYTEKLITETGFTAGSRIKLCGSASEGILDQINSVEYDLVIAGSHGKKGIQRWLGSVSKDILDNAKIPVYISKNKKYKKRILFAVDTYDTSIKFAKKLLEIANVTDSELRLITVFENPDLLFADGKTDTNWLTSIKDKQKNYAEQSIYKIQEYFEKQNIKVSESKILTGLPAQVILENSKDIDLIVMGSNKNSNNKRFFINSVSKRVSENTNCDTLIIKI